MQYKPEFDSREDVFKYVISFNYGGGYDRYQEMIYFVPIGNGKYEFCTRNESPNEQKIQQWMNNVYNKSVVLDAVPYVIADAKFKGLGETVSGSEFLHYVSKTRQFAKNNGLSFHLKRGPRHTIQVVGMAVEHYIETYDNGDLEYKKGEAKKYHLFVRDMMNDNKYIVTLHTSRGMCGSGVCSASWGNIKVEPWTKRCPFTHTPTLYTVIEGFAINPDTLSIRQGFVPSARELYYNGDGDVIANNVFCCDNVGRDYYYPEGSVNVCMDLFRPAARAMDKRPVWIIKGPSGTGKSTLAGHLEGLSVFETDSVDKLPETICSDVIVLGNRSHFTVEDVKSRLFGDPNVMIVSFDRDGHVPQREKSVKKGRGFNPRHGNEGR